MMAGKGIRREGSFKDRVAAFWGWYASVADRFFQEIEAGQCANLTTEVRRQCDKLLPALSWVFGPGENGGHSFTLSGEGQIARQLLAEYWLEQAPAIPNWTFYSSRQPSDQETLAGMQIAVGEQAPVDATGLLLKTHVDAERERIDIAAWHPSFEFVPEEHHMQILFLLLDEAMGEFGTQTWIGSISVEPVEHGTECTTLERLPTFVRDVGNYYKWDKYSPLETYSVYQIPEGFDEHRPSRLFGSTCIPGIVHDLIENGGTLVEDPLDGTGAELVYVAIESDIFPQGGEVDYRGRIEDTIAQALCAERSGRTLGGAFGFGESFIDVLIFDGDNSREIIKQCLNELGILEKCRLVNFA